MLILLAIAVAHLAASQEAMINAAKSYIEDRLKDPFSVQYRHLVVIYTSKSDRKANVCGDVYARNGNDSYNGASQFVVGFEDGKPIGIEWNIDNNEVVNSEFVFLRDKICNFNFTELEADIGRKEFILYAADKAAYAQIEQCQKDGARDIDAASTEVDKRRAEYEERSNADFQERLKEAVKKHKVISDAPIDDELLDINKSIRQEMDQIQNAIGLCEDSARRLQRDIYRDTLRESWDGRVGTFWSPD